MLRLTFWLTPVCRMTPSPAAFSHRREPPCTNTSVAEMARVHSETHLGLSAEVDKVVPAQLLWEAPMMSLRDIWGEHVCQPGMGVLCKDAQLALERFSQAMAQLGLPMLFVLSVTNANYLGFVCQPSHFFFDADPASARLLPNASLAISLAATHA